VAAAYEQLKADLNLQAERARLRTLREIPDSSEQTAEISK
jgi:hypothetical protein